MTRLEFSSVPIIDLYKSNSSWGTAYLATFFHIQDLHMGQNVIQNAEPSGKRLHNYGKSPFIVNFPMKNDDFP
jgi:hypothetical protein